MFVPKKDLWLSCVVWLTIILLALAGLSPLIVGDLSIIGGILIFLVCSAICGFMAWLWLGTYYILNESELIIRLGPITKTIPYERITKAKSVRSWQSSAATSFHRIEIKYGNYDSIQVSPLDREGFVTQLKSRCPLALIETNLSG